MPAASPRSTYVEACEALSVHVNTGVRDMLPDRADAFSDLTRLDFSRQCVGRRGLLPLLPVFERCVSLQELELSDNYLNNESVVELCNCVEKMPTLVFVGLCRNPISYPSGKRIESLIRVRRAGSFAVDVSSTLMNPGLARKIAGGNNPEAVRKPGQPVVTLQAAASSSACVEGAAAPQPPVETAPRTSNPKKFIPNRAVIEDDRWYAMETVWAVAADSISHNADGTGYPGLMSVMAHMRTHEQLADE